MKPKINFCSALCVAAFVLGIASCSYDEELQPPKRLVEAGATNGQDVVGKATPLLPVEKSIVNEKE